MRPNPALTTLRPFVGTWKAVIVWSAETHKLVGGPRELPVEVRFEWIEGGMFLHYQFGHSHWIIGRDDSSSEFQVLYGDDRKVSRVYRMTLVRGTWRIWRDAPGFYQRFEGRFTKDGRTIHAHWERSTDGESWVHDFDITFIRRSVRTE
jgi:hypothetical protein